MPVEMTPAVTRAVDAARRHAKARGAAEVAPAHLLLALLEEEDGGASALASSAGLERWRYESWLGTPSDKLPAADLPLSGTVGRLLRAARAVAMELGGDSTVSGEALLVVIVREDDSSRREMSDRGLDVAKLEAQLSGQGQPPPALEEPLNLTESTERIDAARILDASANRAREGLRVAEDYCRFALDDALLCGELKRLRHDLTAVLEEIAPSTLLEARDTGSDVGTAISTASERQRASLLDVVKASFKRVEEAFRSLEEYGKVLSPRVAEAVEKLRYRVYVIEKAVLLGTSARERLASAKLYVLLSGKECVAALDWTIAEAAMGGAAVVQLREKELPDRALLKRAREVREWTRKAGVLFIVNDRPDVARLAEADGVHLGQDDVSVKEARRIVGPGALIGVSTHNVEQLRQAVLEGASYVGVGPCFASTTKAFESLAGLNFLKEAVKETTLPAFAIGGINAATIGAAVAAGARRVAVSAAVAKSDDPRAAAMALLAALPG
jgi:thiamine-phosphate pyrophosphorylase